MNKINNKRFNVLDRGFIELIDMMGSDNRIVSSARVSYGEKTKGEESDKKLIYYLLSNKHETPFEHVVFTFKIKCPIFVMRQWIRHRIASVNEISGRYTKFNEVEYYVPELAREQDKKNKQSSNIAKWSPTEHELFKKIVRSSTERSVQVYKQLLQYGIAKEIARIVLPVNMYTEFYWTINMRSLINFIKLRCSDDAQFEIREYAKIIRDIAFTRLPWTAEAIIKLQEKPIKQKTEPELIINNDKESCAQQSAV
jgi:thymidylate synthase (FAD)